MSKVINKKLTIFLLLIIVLSLGLILFKVINNSYALPEVEKPILNEVQLISDNPLMIKISYTLNNVTEGYTVEILNDGNVKVENDKTNKNNGINEYVLENLENGKTYNFSIKVCYSGKCETSNEQKITITSKTQQTTYTTTTNIKNINVSKITSNSALVSFNKISGASGYKIKYKRKTASGWNTSNLKNNLVTIKSLKANTKYEFKLTAIKNGKEGNWSSVKSFTTNPVVPNVRGFTAKVASYSQVKLKWNKINNKKIVYAIYRSTDGKKYKWIKELSYKKTSYTNKGLKADKKYYYKVRAIDIKSRSGKKFYGNYTPVKRVKTPLKNKKTYILVSIKKQKMWYYKNGKLKYTSNVVTGLSGKHSTPKGHYAIRGKSRSAYLVGRDYVSFVNYWMLIDGGKQIGLHDATWRWKFGGKIYKTNGSHGCINLPLKTAKYLYNHAPVGTKVIVK